MLDFLRIKFASVLAWLLVISGNTEMISKMLIRVEARQKELFELVRSHQNEVLEELRAVRADLNEIKESVVPGQAVEVELIAGPITEQPL